MEIAPGVSPPDRRAEMWRQAQALETRFLAEMLGHAGLGAMGGSFGGGTGEEQFASFLREAQAEAMVRAGGIGLARHVFDAMAQRSGT